MNFGKCAFVKCKKDSIACYSDDGKPLVVCREHYQILSELHDEAIIEEALGLRSQPSNNQGGNNVPVHHTRL